MDEIYEGLRQMAALAEIVRVETEDLDVERGSRSWKAWNRLVELAGLLDEQMHSLSECAGKLI